MAKQVTFLVDENVKKKAQSRAKSEGLSLKSVLVFSLKAYSEGKLRFGVVNESQNMDIEKIEIKDKNLLKKIDAIEDFISLLDSKGKLPKGSLSEQLRDV